VNAETKKTAYVFFGMVATGKSYLARAWAERQGGLYLNSDIVRKELAGLAQQDRSRVSWNEGIYTPDFTRRTYDELLRRTLVCLAGDSHVCVVLDASYQSQEERNRLRQGLATHCRLLFILCTCPEATVKKRLAERAVDPHAVSDGRWEIYLHQKEHFMPPDELEPAQVLSIDTDRSLAVLLAVLEQAVQEKMNGACAARPV
jgi:predicted kinase